MTDCTVMIEDVSARKRQSEASKKRRGPQKNSRAERHRSPASIQQGENFKRWRLHRNMTLMEAAELAKLTAGALSEIERGARPRPLSIRGLAKAYKVRPADLLYVSPVDGPLKIDPKECPDMESLWESADITDREKIIKIAKTIVNG